MRYTTFNFNLVYIFGCSADSIFNFLKVVTCNTTVISYDVPDSIAVIGKSLKSVSSLSPVISLGSLCAGIFTMIDHVISNNLSSHLRDTAILSHYVLDSIRAIVKSLKFVFC